MAIAAQGIKTGVVLDFRNRPVVLLQGESIVLLSQVEAAHLGMNAAVVKSQGQGLPVAVHRAIVVFQVPIGKPHAKIRHGGSGRKFQCFLIALDGLPGCPSVTQDIALADPFAGGETFFIQPRLGTDGSALHIVLGLCVLRFQVLDLRIHAGGFCFQCFVSRHGGCQVFPAAPQLSHDRACVHQGYHMAAVSECLPCDDLLGEVFLLDLQNRGGNDVYLIPRQRAVFHFGNAFHEDARPMARLPQGIGPGTLLCHSIAFLQPVAHGVASLCLDGLDLRESHGGKQEGEQAKHYEKTAPISHVPRLLILYPSSIQKSFSVPAPPSTG